MPQASLARSLREAVALMQRRRYEDAERIFTSLPAQPVASPPLLHFAGLNAIKLGRKIPCPNQGISWRACFSSKAINWVKPVNHPSRFRS
ncbi:MAG: hypothetical protein ACYCS1_03940 [Gammaproteobacteria bacterium]